MNETIIYNNKRYVRVQLECDCGPSYLNETSPRLTDDEYLTRYIDDTRYRLSEETLLTG